MNKLIISNYKAKYSRFFYELNKTWITEFWDLEESDIADLLKPEKNIISRGGEVFFAIINDVPIGTVAMIPNTNMNFELAKMTIKKEFRGRGLSKLLLEKCISFAQEKKAKSIFLISNRSLIIARKLYDKYGFKEVKLNSQKYERGDVKMVLSII